MGPEDLSNLDESEARLSLRRAFRRRRPVSRQLFPGKIRVMPLMRAAGPSDTDRVIVSDFASGPFTRRFRPMLWLPVLLCGMLFAAIGVTPVAADGPHNAPPAHQAAEPAHAPDPAHGPAAAPAAPAAHNAPMSQPVAPVAAPAPMRAAPAPAPVQSAALAPAMAQPAAPQRAALAPVTVSRPAPAAPAMPHPVNNAPFATARPPAMPVVAQPNGRPAEPQPAVARPAPQQVAAANPAGVAVASDGQQPQDDSSRSAAPPETPASSKLSAAPPASQAASPAPAKPSANSGDNHSASTTSSTHSAAGVQPSSKDHSTATSSAKTSTSSPSQSTESAPHAAAGVAQSTAKANVLGMPTVAVSASPAQKSASVSSGTAAPQAARPSGTSGARSQNNVPAVLVQAGSPSYVPAIGAVSRPPPIATRSGLMVNRIDLLGESPPRAGPAVAVPQAVEQLQPAGAASVATDVGAPSSNTVRGFVEALLSSTPRQVLQPLLRAPSSVISAVRQVTLADVVAPEDSLPVTVPAIMPSSAAPATAAPVTGVPAGGGSMTSTGGGGAPAAAILATLLAGFLLSVSRLEAARQRRPREFVLRLEVPPG